MGKSKRAKLNRQNEEARRAEAEALKKAEKREMRKIYIAVVAVILAVSIVVGGIALAVLNIRKTGNYLRDKVSVSSENYEVNNAMLSYLFADNFYMQKSYYDYYQSYFGLDTEMPLKNQKYNDDATWYDYFLNEALKNAASMLIADEAAKAEGVTLDDEDKLFIDREIEKLRRDAETVELDFDEYLSEYYGLGVKEEDIRDALELYYISFKYYYHQLEGINITSDDIKAYYDANADDYLRVYYTSYNVNAIHVTGETEAEKKAANDAAKAAADKLASASDAAEFEEYLIEYLTDLYKRNGTGEKGILELKEEIKGYRKEGVAYSEGGAGMDWLFADERKSGDTTVVENGEGKYTVYFLDSAKAREEYKTQNVRHILFMTSDYDSEEACLAAAEAALAEFNKTDKSEESFAKLAKKLTSDTGSVYTGGLYENVIKGEMVEEFEGWIYDTDRKAGDVEIVESESYGYHIMYYVGEGLEAWEAAVRDTVESTKYSELSEKISEKYEIKVDSKKASKIPDVNK